MSWQMLHKESVAHIYQENACFAGYYLRITDDLPGWSHGRRLRVRDDEASSEHGKQPGEGQ